MRKSDLKALINECIHEVLAEETANTKAKAINEIKRIIAENELTEEELEEILGLGKSAEEKYATDVERLTKQYMELYKKAYGKDPSDNEVKNSLEHAKGQDKYNGEFKIVKDSKGKNIIQYDSKSRSAFVQTIQKLSGGKGGAFMPGNI